MPRRSTRSRIPCTLAAVSLAGLLGTGLGSGPQAAFAEIVIDLPLSAAAAETSWRWIGLVSQPGRPGCAGDNTPQDPGDHRPPQVPPPRGGAGRSCPEAPEWTVQPLFDPEDGAAIPPGLGCFCLYETTADPPDVEALTNLVDAGRLSDVRADHMAVGIQGDVLRAAIWEPLHQHFLEQAGAVAPPAGLGVRPLLAFLDTAPTNGVNPEDGWTDSSPHGYTLVNMAQELLCAATSGACAADVVSRLTLAHKDLSPLRDSANGGYVGTLGELAAAIRRTVHVWRQAGAVEPLILNLSLGWDGALFGGGEAVDTMPLDVRAVHHALRDAACRGVAVIAAAGNAGGGPAGDSGPLYPAAWEELPAPSLPACRSALDPGAADPTLSSGGYRPLVYAAGGLRADGEPLANTRPGGEPRLAAFADHAVAEDARPAPTAVLTGSSVAAAVVSAAAAAVWHYRPGDNLHEVMEIVYAAGSDLLRNADFCLGGPGCPDAVRRVSVCEAVHFACALGGSSCPILPPCPTLQPLDLSAVSLPVFPTSVDLGDAQDTITFSECMPDGTLLYEMLPADPCPHRQYHGLANELWTGPQPGSDPCSSCWIEQNVSATAGKTTDSATGSSTTGVLYLEIDSRFEGALTSPTLIIGSQAYSLSVATPLTAGSRVEVVDAPDPGGSPVFLAFTVDGDRSATSPMLVVE